MSTTIQKIETKYIAIAVIIVLFVICMMIPAYNQCQKETFDCIQNRPISSFNLDLIARKIAGELSDMTTNIIVTPNVKGHDIERDISVIELMVEDDNFAVDYLREPLSEMLYYFIQMGDSPFMATNPMDAHREELEYMQCLIDAYSKALEQALTYQRKVNCEHGYNPDTFKTVLTNYLLLTLKQGAVKIYDTYDRKRSNVKKELNKCDGGNTAQLRRLRTILGDNRFNNCGCDK